MVRDSFNREEANRKAKSVWGKSKKIKMVRWPNGVYTILYKESWEK